MTRQDPRRATIRYLEKLARDYYQHANLAIPADFRLREFAAQLWGRQGYVRHMAFTSHSAIRDYVASKGPRHFYYSSARYEQPGAPDMDQKGWRSADLVFDIDADHLDECSHSTIEVEDPDTGVKASFVDDDCIKLAAHETVRLVEALVAELGFSRESIRVEFSGHRGFHVVVELPDSDEWARAGSDARRELVNYLAAKDVMDDTLFPKPQATRTRRKPRPLPPSTMSPGLRGRLARIARQLALEQGRSDIASLFENPVNPAVSVSDDDVQAFLETAKGKLGIHVDEQVTVDTKRLIRVPGSINGKTMLPVVLLDTNRLDDFALTTDMSPFNSLGPIRIRMLVDTPQVRIMGHRLRLKRGESYRLPAPIALYLLAKEVAVLSLQ